MRFCEYCGSQRSEKAKYCPRCGKKVNESNVQTVISPDTDSQHADYSRATNSFAKVPQENIEEASSKGVNKHSRQKKIIGMLAAVVVVFAIMLTIGLPPQLMKISDEKIKSRDNIDEKDGYLGIPWGTLPDAITGLGKGESSGGRETVYEISSDTSALTGKTVPDKERLMFLGKQGLSWAMLDLSDGHSVRMFLENKFGRPKIGLSNISNGDAYAYEWTTGVTNGICLIIFPGQLKAKGYPDARLIVFNKQNRPGYVRHIKY